MPPTDSATLNRREALIKLLRLGGAAAGTAGLGFWLSEHSDRPATELALNLKRSHTVASDAALPEMAVIQGDDPEQLARTALEELGGIHRFVSRTDIVLVKPNIGWDRTPEQAANTNPKIVAEIVRQCWNAGAKRVISCIRKSTKAWLILRISCVPLLPSSIVIACSSGTAPRGATLMMSCSK